jgi:hypothetical protein
MLSMDDIATNERLVQSMVQLLGNEESIVDSVRFSSLLDLLLHCSQRVSDCYTLILIQLIVRYSCYTYD